MKSMLCLIGYHLWKDLWTKPLKLYPLRECVKCGKKQHGTYDMMYGKTVWFNGWPIEAYDKTNDGSENEHSL